MPRRSTRRLVAVAILALMACLLPATSGTPAGAAATGVVTTTRTIVVRDGIGLRASVSRPAGAAQAEKYPLVVMPGTFAGDSIRLDAVGAALAARGYVTVAYLERGFGSSGGRVDGAGPKDVADVSDVITWARSAQAALPVDRSKVGLAGLSYGGGIALIAAAQDPRVDVVATLSGWGDLAGAFYPNRTRAVVTMQGLVGVLLTLGQGRPSSEVLTAFRDGIDGRRTQENLAWVAGRSGITYRARLAERKVPLYMSLPLNETVFPVDQSIAYWRGYTGPKHLDLRPGDHANSELVGVGDAVSDSWVQAFRWFDAHLAGTDPSKAAEPPVRLVPRSPDGFRPVERPDDVTPTTTRRLYLRSAPGPFGLGGTFGLGPTPGTGQVQLRQGVNVLARPPFPLYYFAGEALTGLPPSVTVPFVDEGVARMWRSEPLPARLRYRGAMTVDLDVVPSATRGTLVVSAYDVPPPGLQAIPLSRQPWSFTGATPGRPLDVRFDLPYNAFDLPAGHRLAVVVSTSDVTWSDSNPDGARITVLPTSSVTVPVG